MCFVDNNHLDIDERQLRINKSKQLNSLSKNFTSGKEMNHSPTQNQAIGPDPSFSLTTFDFQLTNKHSSSIISHIQSEEKFNDIDHFAINEPNINAE